MRIEVYFELFKENGSEVALSAVSAIYMLVLENVHHSYIKNYHRWLSMVGRQDNLEVFASWLAEEVMWEKKAKETTASSREPEKPTFRTGRREKKTYSSQKQTSAVSRLH